MRVAILPSGALLAHPVPDDETPDGLSPAARGRVARAFARGPGHALLDLGAAQIDTPLAPPLAYLREVGRAFVTRLCGLPDLEAGASASWSTALRRSTPASPAPSRPSKAGSTWTPTGSRRAGRTCTTPSPTRSAGTVARSRPG